MKRVIEQINPSQIPNVEFLNRYFPEFLEECNRSKKSEIEIELMSVEDVFLMAVGIASAYAISQGKTLRIIPRK